MRNLIVLLFSVSLAGLLSSCQSNPTVETGADLTIAEDEVMFIISESELGEEVTAASFAGHLAEAGTKGDFVNFRPNTSFPDCAEVTVSGDEFPKEIIIDFGEECLTRNGRLRSGKIYITISDKMTNPGAEYSILYEDIVFGNRAIDKVATVTNLGQNDSGNWVIAHQLERTVHHGDTLSIKREFSGEKEWIDGFLTPEFTDNKFYRTGGGTITVNEDIKYMRTITTPLYIDRACRFILSGVVEIVRGDESMTIDFGDGECDNKAVVTKDGVEEEIDLTTGKFKRKIQRRIRHLLRNKGWW